MSISQEGVKRSVLDAGLIMAYLGLNSTLNLLNRWALGIYGFRFPVFMTICHMLFSCLMLFPMMMLPSYRDLHTVTLRRSWKGITCIGCFMAGNISLNNASLVHMTLSLNQVIRASIPVITALMAICVEARWPSRLQAGGLLPISMGVMLAVYDASSHASLLGLSLCGVATVSNALMMTTSGRVLTEKLDVLRLTFYTAPVSVLVLAPVFMQSPEYPAFVEYMQDSKRSQGAAVLLLLGSGNALLYNVVHYMMIQRMNATTTTVLGNVKVVGLMLLSSLLFGETKEWGVRMFAGCFTTLSGFAVYSYASLRQQGGDKGGDKGGGKAGGADVEVGSALGGHRSHGAGNFKHPLHPF